MNHDGTNVLECFIITRCSSGTSFPSDTACCSNHRLNLEKLGITITINAKYLQCSHIEGSIPQIIRIKRWGKDKRVLSNKNNSDDKRVVRSRDEAKNTDFRLISLTFFSSPVQSHWLLEVKGTLMNSSERSIAVCQNLTSHTLNCVA